MLKLLPVSFAVLFLAGLSHYLSSYNREYLAYERKERLCWCAAAILMILTVGLRVKYNDTGTYVHAYELMAQRGGLWEDIRWSVGMNPGFAIVNACMARIGIDAQSFLMIYAVLTVGIYLWFIRKYSDHLGLSMWLFLCAGCYVFTMAAIKQTAAVALCLVGTDRALQGKYLRFTLWVLAAATFHPYALMYLAVPFLMFPPWQEKTHIMLLTFGAVGCLLRYLLGFVVNITTRLGEEYSIASFTGDGIHPLRLALVAVPAILAYAVREQVWEEGDTFGYLAVNLSMLNAEIMFVGLFGTANYFGRLANYFLIFQTLSIPWLLKYFKESDRRILYAGMIVGYGLYFLYANGINQPFDMGFDSISLAEYFKSLIGT